MAESSEVSLSNVLSLFESMIIVICAVIIKNKSFFKLIFMSYAPIYLHSFVSHMWITGIIYYMLHEKIICSNILISY
jgi:hypothetical protein